jgi:hypothetical protein
LTMARISSCRPAPSPPAASANPELSTTAERTPALPQRSSSAGTCCAGIMRIARSAGVGRSATEG